MEDYNVVFNRRKLKWTNVIFLICMVLVIILSAFFGRKLAEKRFEKYVEDISNENFEKLTKTDEDIVETPAIEEATQPQKKIPVVTEQGKTNIKNIYKSEYKRVFLTFDDGPSRSVTPLILDVLKANNVKATFFTLGSRVKQNPQIVKRAYEEGHYIANHGYSHVYSNIYASRDAVLDEFNRTEDAIRVAIEVPEYSSYLFRFPGGSLGGKYNTVKKDYRAMLDELGIMYIDWNSLTQDSMGKYTKEQMMQFLIETSVNKNSVVVLMHDAGDKVLTYEMLQDIINYFRENGYVFENMYDVIEYEVR